jgi:plasmid stability protein
VPVDLSIKRVPDALAERLRKRARQNNRSLQGELMAILQEAVGSGRTKSTAGQGDRVRERLAPTQEYWTSRRDVAPRSEAALMIREDRDGRTFTVNDLFQFVTSLGPGTPNESTGWIRKARSSR